MKSLSIAVYSLIAIHFLRRTARKLSPDSPRKFPGVYRGNSPGRPMQVGVGITYTASSPGPEGSSTYEYFRIATCTDLDTAGRLLRELNAMRPEYPHRFSLTNPVREYSRDELEALAAGKISLNLDAARKCPEPGILTRMLRAATLSILTDSRYIPPAGTPSRM